MKGFTLPELREISRVSPRLRYKSDKFPPVTPGGPAIVHTYSERVPNNHSFFFLFLFATRVAYVV